MADPINDGQLANPAQPVNPPAQNQLPAGIPAHQTTAIDFKYMVPIFHGNSVSEYMAWRQAFRKLQYYIQVNTLSGKYLVDAIFHSFQGQAANWLLAEVGAEVLTALAQTGDTGNFLRLTDTKYRVGNTNATILSEILNSRFTGTNFEAYQASLEAKFDALVGDNYKDAFEMLKAAIIINSFPLEYRQRLSTVSHNYQCKQVWQHLNGLYVENQLPSSPSVAQASSSNLVAGVSSNQSSNLFCRYCRTPGHSIDECRKRLKNNARRQSSKSYNNQSSSDSDSNNPPSSSKSQKRPFKPRVGAIVKPIDDPAVWELNVGGKLLNCLYDTGARVSLIREDALPGVIPLETSDDTATFSLADGTPLHSEGLITTTVTIGKYHLPAQFHIVKSLDCDVFLGLDFIKKYNVVPQ